MRSSQAELRPVLQFVCLCILAIDTILSITIFQVWKNRGRMPFSILAYSSWYE